MNALFFSLLLFFLLLFVNKNDPLYEGITSNSSQEKNTQVYQPYNGNNPMILAQKNAANIEYLQEKMKQLQDLEKNFSKLDTSVGENTDNIKKMAQYAAHHITQTTGITPSGAVPPSVSNLSSVTNDPENKI